MSSIVEMLDVKRLPFRRCAAGTAAVKPCRRSLAETLKLRLDIWP